MKPKSYHPDDGLYRCPQCEGNANVKIIAQCQVVFQVNDDGYVVNKRTGGEHYNLGNTVECLDCGYKGLLGTFLMGYCDESLDPCPECEHTMEIPAADCDANGTPGPDATVHCRECDAHTFPLVDWRERGWQCLATKVKWYGRARKSCPRCAERVDFVDVTGKARDGMMLCRCSACAHWWAEPEDGHPDHDF